MKKSGQIKAENWYKYTVNQLEKKFTTSVSDGLTSEQVKKNRVRKNDVLYDIKSLREEKITEYIFNLLSVLLVVLNLFSYLSYGSVSALVCTVLVVFIYIFWFLAFYKSKKIFASSEKYSVPRVRVIRNKKVVLIEINDVVSGDIVLLCEGDIVPCDGRIAECNNLKVLEANISGGDGIKDASFICYEPNLNPNEQKNMIFAMSVVTSGNAKIIACDTGNYTLVKRTKRQKVFFANENIKLFDLMKSLSKKVTLFMIALLFVMSFTHIIVFGLSDNTYGAFMQLISLCVASMSELYIVFAYLMVAVGIYSNDKKISADKLNCFVKNISSIDRLREITCLAIPKSTVLCENKLEIEYVFAQNSEYSINDKEQTEKMKHILTVAALSCDVIGEKDLRSKNLSCEEEAIFDYWYQNDIEELFNSCKVIDHRAIDNESIFETTLAYYDGKISACERGNAEQIVNRCTGFYKDGQIVPFEADTKQNLIKTACRFEENSYLVVAVASKNPLFDSLKRIGYMQDDLVFEGFLAMREPVQNNAADLISEIKDSGMKLLLFCEDMSKQNVYLAKKLGIINNEANVIYGYELENRKTELLNQRLFIGLSPNQKKFVINCYEKSGEKVGVAVKGLFDITFAKSDSAVSFVANMTVQSNKGVEKLKASGSEALKLTSDVVAVSAQKSGVGGLNSMVMLLRSVKSIYKNMYGLMKYLLISQIMRFFAVTVTLFSDIYYISDFQILFSGLFVDLGAAVVFAFDKRTGKLGEKVQVNRKDIMKAAASAVAYIMLVICIPFVLNGFGITQSDKISFSVFWSIILIQLAVLWCCKGKTKSSLIKNKNTKLSDSYAVLFLIVVEIAALSVLFANKFNVVGFGVISLAGALIAIVPAVIILIVNYFIQKPFN